MPSKYRLRKYFAPFVKILGKFFIKLKVTPNQATVLMLLSACIAILSYAFWHNLFLFGIWVFITGLMDGVDGAIARMTQTFSKFGGILDSTMDRISEVVIYTGLLWFHSELLIFGRTINICIIWILLVSSNLISYTRARIELVGKETNQKYDTNIGFFGRSERLFYLFLLSTLSQFVGAVFFSWGLLIFSMGTTATFLYRFFRYKKFLCVKEEISDGIE